MRSLRVAFVVAAVVGLTGPLYADVIHLKNGNRLQVEGWRDAGDAIEFLMGGGIVRIPKAEVNKIDGKPTQGDFRMYSSGVSTATGPADEQTVVGQMADLLKQGEALFAQTVLSPPEKAGAFRRLGEQWRGVEVPDPLRPVHARGETAIQMAVEAFADEDLPDINERVEKAKAELAAVQDEVRKRTAAGGGQG